MQHVRIAAQLHPQHGDYPQIRAAVVRAEELGYDIAYTWDHFFPLYGEGANTWNVGPCSPAGPRRRSV